MGDEANLLGTLGQNGEEEDLLGNLGQESANNQTEYLYNSNNGNLLNNSENEAAPVARTLFSAIKDGDLEELKAFFQSMTPTEILQTKDTKGLVNKATSKAVETGLNDARYRKHREILQFLLQEGFNANELNPDNKHLTPLNMVARGTGRVGDIIDLLKQFGANLEGTRTTTPPIFDAIQFQNQKVLENFLLKGADKNKEWANSTPLAMAIRSKWVAGVATLLESGASISSIDLIGDNIFIMSVRLEEDVESRKQNIIQLLLTQNVRADFLNRSRKTALMIAAQQGDLETLRTLLDDRRFAATLNLDAGRGTALALIFQTLFESPKPSGEESRRLQQAAELLLERGAVLQNVTIERSAGPYPIFLAAVDTGDIALADLVLGLLGRGPSPINTAGGPYNLTPLGYAAAKDNVTMVEFLIERGANPDTASAGGTTPLETAVIHGSQDVFETLLRRGAALSGDMIHTLVESTPDDASILFNSLLTAILARGLDMNEKDADNMTPLMIAAQKGKASIVKALLERGADPTLTKINGNPLTPTAYDMAKDMAVRLVIAPYLETDEPRFRGYMKDDFEQFNLIFQEPITFVVCPFCFLRVEHNGGCMYIFEHSCLRTQEQQRRDGFRTLAIIHDKLFQTYKDEKQNITVCHHCNRAGYTWTEDMVQGQELVGHAHIELNTANAFIIPRQARKGQGANYYDRTGCAHQGGGSHNEKFLRIQVLLNFLCFMNQHFVGRISKLRAQLLAREMFWDAPLYNGQYLTSRYFSHEIADAKIGDVFPEFRNATVKTLIETIRTNKTFFKLCDHPTEPLPLPEGIVNVGEKERVYANIPRYGTNATDLAPAVVGRDGVDGKHCYYPSITLDDLHNDGRNLWGFKHRQPGTKTVYDHEEHNTLICGPCLELFLRINIVDAKNVDKQIICFTEECNGHFHPSEVQGIVSDEVYQAYKAYYNRFAPVLGGGKRNQETDDSPLIAGTVFVEQDSCLIRFRGGKKTTRKVRKSKKTRKARRLRKTRRSN